LSRNIISIKELQDWLEIDAGAAAFIMEHAQEDVSQFKEAGPGLLYYYHYFRLSRFGILTLGLLYFRSTHISESNLLLLKPFG